MESGQVGDEMVLVKRRAIEAMAYDAAQGAMNDEPDDTPSWWEAEVMPDGSIRVHYTDSDGEGFFAWYAPPEDPSGG